VHFKLYYKARNFTTFTVLSGFFTDSFNVFSAFSRFLFLIWIKDKKWNKPNRKFVYSDLPFPLQLHRIKCEENFSVLWLFLATVACHLNSLSVRSLHTQYEQLAEFTAFLCPYLSHKTHIHAVCFRLSSQFQGNWLCLTNPHTFHDTASVSVCISAISPSYYRQSYHSISHRIHVQTYSTLYINYINRPDNFLESASEISDTNFQWNCSNGIRDTAENVHCSSGTVHLIIDPSIPNI
jgi:hypothetical protein